MSSQGSEKGTSFLYHLRMKRRSVEDLKIDSGGKQGQKSPVAVAKALHLLAPHFFPLWDSKIARAYRCNYASNPAEKYVAFSKMMQAIAERARSYTNESVKPLLKMIDEYNFVNFSGWS